MNESSGQVTAEIIRKAIEGLLQAPRGICGSRDFHVVSPQAMEVKGWATCANCFESVWLGEPEN